MRNVATYRFPQENATRLIQIYYVNIDSHALNTIILSAPQQCNSLLITTITNILQQTRKK